MARNLGFATILLATSTGLLLKRMVRFFNHNPPDDPENKAKELHVSLPPKPKSKHKRNKSKAHSLLNDLTEVEIEGKEETASPLIAIPKQNANENQITTNIDDTITTQAHTNLNQEAPNKYKYIRVTKKFPYSTKPTNTKCHQLNLIHSYPKSERVIYNELIKDLTQITHLHIMIQPDALLTS